MKQETKVGIVIILGTLAIAAAIMILSGIRIFERGYQVNVYFNDIQGLLKQAKVQVAGVNVGYVKDITLENGKAKVTVWLDSDVKIHKDASVYIFTTGIIGVKFIQITVGTEIMDLLKNGDSIVGIDPISIDKMFDKTQAAINSLLDSLQGLTSGNDIKATLENLNRFSKDLTSISAEIKKIVANGTVISTEIKNAIANNKLTNISKKLDSTLTSLQNISSSIENGNGALGKLVMDKKVESDLKDTIKNLRVFSKMMEDAPSKWIVDDKKSKEVKSQLQREMDKEENK